MSKFGWCLTGQHDRCTVSHVDWNNKECECSCTCHSGKEASS